MSDLKLTKRLSFLGKRIKLVNQGRQVSGTVFYFTENAIILEIDNKNFEVINVQNFEYFTIQVQESQLDSSTQTTNLNQQTITAAQILPKIIE